MMKSNIFKEKKTMKCLWGLLILTLICFSNGCTPDTVECTRTAVVTEIVAPGGWGKSTDTIFRGVDGLQPRVFIRYGLFGAVGDTLTIRIRQFEDTYPRNRCCPDSVYAN